MTTTRPGPVAVTLRWAGATIAVLAVTVIFTAITIGETRPAGFIGVGTIGLIGWAVNVLAPRAGEGSTDGPQ